MIETEVIYRPDDGCVIVRVGGEIDISTQAQLTEALDRALATRAPMVMVDLAGVLFLSAAAVGCMERAFALIRTRGDAAYLVCPDTGPVWRVVSLLGLGAWCSVHHVPRRVVAGAGRSSDADLRWALGRFTGSHRPNEDHVARPSHTAMPR